MKKNKTGRKWMARVLALFAVCFIFTAAMMIKASAQNEVTIEPHKGMATDAVPSVHEPAAAATEEAHTGEEPGVAQPMAASGDVVTDSSKTQIEIGLTYHGDKLEFFGSIGNTGADAVIVKLTSPAEKVKLNQKGRVGPLWMNTKQHVVENVPFMYKIHASQSIDTILTPEQQVEYGIGFDALRSRLVIETVKGKPDPADEEAIFNGLLKIKKEQNLYKIDDKDRVAIKHGALFKHFFNFPSAAKEGDYIVETYLFGGGKLVGFSTDTIHVRKVGLEAKVVHWANERPKTYGVCAVLIALCTGLLVGIIFKGGAH